MPPGFGRNSFVGWVEEPAYGTPVTPPTQFGEIVSEGLRTIRERVPRPVHRSLDVGEGDLYDAKFGADGPFVIELNYEGQLRLLEHLFGAGATANEEPAIRDAHTFTLTDLLLTGKGLTIYKNIDLDEHQYKGCKITQAKFVFSSTGNGQIELTLVGQDGVSVAGSTFVAPDKSLYVAGHQIVVELDDAARSVDAVELTINNALDEDKRVLGSKSIDEPVRGDSKREITGIVTVDALASDWTGFRDGTLFKLEVLHTGPVLGAGNYRWEMIALKCLATEDPMRMPGPGILKAEIAFRVEKPTVGEMLSVVVANGEPVIG